MSKFICKVFGHKMYNISYSQTDFVVLCTRCEKNWQSDGVITHE